MWRFVTVYGCFGPITLFIFILSRLCREEWNNRVLYYNNYISTHFISLYFCFPSAGQINALCPPNSRYNTLSSITFIHSFIHRTTTTTNIYNYWLLQKMMIRQIELIKYFWCTQNSMISKLKSSLTKDHNTHLGH